MFKHLRPAGRGFLPLGSSPRIERRRNLPGVALLMPHVAQRAARLRIRTHEQGEEPLPHVRHCAVRLRHCSTLPQCCQELQRQLLRLPQLHQRKRRMPRNLRPALAKHRRERQRIADQPPVAPLLAQARQRVGIDPAVERQAPRLTPQLLAQHLQRSAERRHAHPHLARGTVACVRVL
jgi:hypothetical protein